MGWSLGSVIVSSSIIQNVSEFQIVGQMMDADNMKVHYGRLTTNLLEWIKMKVSQLNDRNFPNSLEGIQKELLAFKQYRTIEKPPK